MMAELAVRTVGLGKRYRIGGERERFPSLREVMIRAAKRPIERIRHPGSATYHSVDLWALREIDLEIPHGEVLGVIGANGSGKSTLLKILSHITQPTEGRVEIRGRVASLLEVGTGFHPELTGRENIQLNGAILGMRRAEIKAKFDEIVSFSGVEKFLDTPVKRYSSGMYVRLAFAVAAHLDPEILLVDEVLAVGDAEFQAKCLNKMGDAARSGRTVFLVSHNMAAIQGLCNSAILLDKGRIAARGNVAEVVGHYLSQTTPGTVNSSEVLAESDDGAVQLAAVRIRDSEGRLRQVAQCGEGLQVEIVLRCSRPIEGGVATAGINDAHGRRIAVLHPGISGFSADLEPGVHSFVCDVERMPLSPGTYLLDIEVLARGGFRPDDSLLWAPRCVSLDIITGDYYGTGRIPLGEWAGVVQLAQQWSHVRENGGSAATR